MKRSTATQDIRVSIAMRTQLPQYPHSHGVEVVYRPSASPNAIFLGLNPASSEIYDPDQKLLIRSDHSTRRVIGYPLDVEI